MLTSIVNPETFDEVKQQIGLIHGGYQQCSNKVKPAVHVRLDSPIVHQWLRQEIKIPNFWPVVEDTGNFHKLLLHILFVYVCVQI